MWIDGTKLACFQSLDKEVLNRSVADKKIAKHVTQPWGQFTVSEKPVWQQDCPASRALAVADNCVVVADASQVTAFELESGSPLWTHSLNAPPVLWGLAINSNGEVIIVQTNGQVTCLGSN